MNDESTQLSTEKSKPLNRRNVLTRTNRFGPNMTPMVDVTLVILIFFMASATIAGHEWFLKADLPRVQDPDLQSSGFSLPDPVLNADLFMNDNQVFVRGISDEPRTLELFMDQLSQMDQGLTKGLILSIRAADDVPYQAVVSLHAQASKRDIRVAIR